MPRGIRFVVAATAIWFVGLGIAVAGVITLAGSDKSLGAGLLGAGIAVVLLGGWVSTFGR